MTEQVQTNILNPGIKFVVLDEPKDGAFPPGTTGFMGCLTGKSSRNNHVYSAQVVIIRKGKGGKDRVDVNSINTPIFLTDEMQENKAYHEVLPFGAKYYVHIKTVPMENTLLAMSNIDFIGWAGAYNQYVQNLTGFSNHPFRWPEDKSNPLNITSRLNERWANDPGHLLDLFSSKEFRVKTVNVIRKTEASLIKCVASYQYRLAQTIKAAAIQLARYADEYGAKVVDKEAMMGVVAHLDKLEQMPKKKKNV